MTLKMALFVGKVAAVGLLCLQGAFCAIINLSSDNETSGLVINLATKLEQSSEDRLATPSIDTPSTEEVAANAPASPLFTLSTSFTMVASEMAATMDTEAVRHSFGRHIPAPHFHLPDSRFAPFFEEGPEPHNITSCVGSPVLLDCRIGLLQPKTVVTWTYHKGDFIHLLTVDRNAHSSDDRITLSFRYPNNFRLSILYVTKRDEGLYECQVATHPPKVKRIFLKVKSPEIKIVDDLGRGVTERYYKAGSSLELSCAATLVGNFSKDQPIIWRHGDRVLAKGIRFNVSTITETAISNLTVAPLKKRHSGNYTCGLGTLVTATVAVHVLNGELPAAVHGDGVVLHYPTGLTLVLLATLLLVYNGR